MIAGFSKCDFRNLGEILSGHIFFQFFFQDKKIHEEHFQIFSEKKFEISHKARFHEIFPYKAISHDFQLKFIDFPLFLKTTSKRYSLPRHA